MAQYQHLLIYKASYDVFFKFVNLINHFPREYKYSLGERIQNVAIDIIVLIYKANSSNDKSVLISKIIENIQLLYLFLRLSHDLKIISVDKYAEIIEMLDGISKQACGWQKSNNFS